MNRKDRSDSEPNKQPEQRPVRKKAYQAPSFRVERVFETTALNSGTALGQVGLFMPVGSGTSQRRPSIEQVFQADDAPALANQPDYFQMGLFFDADYRDQPGNPRSGGHYLASWTSFQDHKLSKYDFAQYDIEAQQYIPFFNKRRVIALRAKSTFQQTSPGQEVPFFLQPTLGGSEDLRGYREFRFRDRNMVVFNAEYRWEAFSGLDLALFGDAGQVAPRPSELRFSDLQTAYGVGFRFNSEKSVFLRVDLGFSREGQQVFVKFGHVF